MRVAIPFGTKWRQHHRPDGTPKVAYPSLAAAQRVRLEGADAYLCRWCRHWHLGNPRTLDA